MENDDQVPATPIGDLILLEDEDSKNLFPFNDLDTIQKTMEYLRMVNPTIADEMSEILIFWEWGMGLSDSGQAYMKALKAGKK